MKRFLKRFVKLSWKGIPIGIIASVLIGTVVLAAVFITVTQTITQKIVEPEPEPVYDYGEIVAPNIALSNLETGKSFTRTIVGGVTVDLGPDGAGAALRLSCNASPLYSSFDVEITLTDKPEGSEVWLVGYSVSGGGEVSIELDLPGLYIFDQTITGKAGGGAGSAQSTITLTLEESTFPPGP
jgi:hypothetical protein